VFVYYWAAAGEWYHNGPALVTGVNRDGSYDLTVFPKGSEPLYRERIGRKTDKLQHVCWEEYPSAPAVSPGISALQAEIADLKTQLAELAQRRGPGRPPNSARVA
jgi:hypothetical protein